MLALVILGVASALVVVNMPPPEPTLAREARVLAARLAAAGEEAVLSGAPVGVELDATGYRFSRRIARDWLVIRDDPALEPRAWPAGVSVDVVREGAPLDLARLEAGADRSADEPENAPPVLRFDAVGAATAATLDLRAPGEAYRISVDAAGEVALARGGR